MILYKIFNNKNIKTAALGSLILKFLSAFFAFLSSVLLAKTLGLNGYGLYVLSFTTIILLSIPVTLGLPTLITRYIPKYEVENNNGAIKGLLIKSNQYIVVSTLIVFIIAYLSYLIWWKNFDLDLVKTLICSFLFLPFLTLNTIRAAALRGMKYVILGQLSDTLLRNFFLCSSLIFYFFTETSLTPSKAMLINVISSFIAFLISSLILRAKLMQKIKEVKSVFYTKEWLKQTLPFSINSGLQVLKSKLTTYILALFGSVGSIAIFDVAMRFATLVSFTLDALNLAIAPYISEAFERKNMVHLQKIVTKTSRIIFVFALPVSLLFIFFGSPIINYLFGEDYSKSYIPLIILCLGQLLNAATGSVALVLNMTGNQVYVTKTVVLIIILNLLLSIPAAIYYDVVGVSLIFSLVIIIQNLVLVIYAKNKLKINTTVF